VRLKALVHAYKTGEASQTTMSRLGSHEDKASCVIEQSPVSRATPQAPLFSLIGMILWCMLGTYTSRYHARALLTSRALRASVCRCCILLRSISSWPSPQRTGSTPSTTPVQTPQLDVPKNTSKACVSTSFVFFGVVGKAIIIALAVKLSLTCFRYGNRFIRNLEYQWVLREHPRLSDGEGIDGDLSSIPFVRSRHGWRAA
jgi:hypothetical protein